MKIAVVGSGISGLAACFYLSKLGHQVTIFEKSDRLGMDQFWAEIPEQAVNSNRAIRCDVPPRMFQNRQWPNLVDLYQAASVPTTLAESGRSYSRLGSRPFLQIDQNLKPKLGFQLLGRLPQKILSEIQRLRDLAQKTLSESDSKASANSSNMGQFLREHRFDADFIYQFLYPSLSSTVCTCSFSALDDYPAMTLLSGMQNLLLEPQLLRSAKGTGQVAKTLACLAFEIKYETEVTSLSQDISGNPIDVHSKSGKLGTFDHVIVATQASIASQFARKVDPQAYQLLKEFPDQSVPVIVHSDLKLMPPGEKNWESFNMISDFENQNAMCSIWLNKFYNWEGLDRNYFQTILPIIEPAPELIIKSTIMNRAVVTKESLQAAQRLQGIQSSDKKRQIWYCGSYITDQIPLLESGVLSAKDVTQRVNLNPSE